MFLMGAVLLSAVFFASAALQASTPFVAQSVETPAGIHADWAEAGNQFMAATSSCDTIDPFDDETGCVAAAFEYWYLHQEAHVALDCSGGDITLTFTKGDSQMVYVEASSSC